MTTEPDKIPPWAARALARPEVHYLAGMVILGVDYLTGPSLQFPILFVVPVSLAAWYCRARIGYSLAVLLPTGRGLIAGLVEQPHDQIFIAFNALIRVVVLSYLAFLVARTARQTRQLEERISGLVTMCAWSRTIEYQGEWISFEEYLKRRFNISTSHGVSPTEARKFFEKTGEPKREG